MAWLGITILQASPNLKRSTLTVSNQALKSFKSPASTIPPQAVDTDVDYCLWIPVTTALIHVRYNTLHYYIH